MNIIGMSFSLARYLGQQPLQIMGKLGAQPHSKSYLFNVEIWHESLFAQNASAQLAAERGPAERERKDAEATLRSAHADEMRSLRGGLGSSLGGGGGRGGLCAVALE